VNVALGMVAALVTDVGFDPFEIFCAEADDAITRLPLEDFSSEALVDVVGGGAFQFADQITDENSGRDANGEMDVIIGTTDS
jgi:hypothetical protein